VLLSDAKVSSFLAEHFVLYWSTVRPAPKVTIDFGNGHLLERTLKGNTIFYVVRSDGRVVDAVPGVYLPDAFLSELNQSLELLALSDAEVLERHATEAVTLRFQAVGMNSASAVATLSKAPVQGPLIRAIEPTTVSKAVLQSPMIAGLEDPHPATTETPSIVDVSSLPLTTDELEEAYLPGPGTLAERALKADSESSVKVLRPAVHRWFAERSNLPAPADCRSPIYKDILKVDIDDPYLGLKVDGMPGTD
jgi:hypothetical protein